MFIIESIIVGTIGIFVGFLIGVFVSIFIVKLLQILLLNFSKDSIGFYFARKSFNILTNSSVKLECIIPTSILIFIVFFLYAIVLISCLLPMREINKISIMEAIRNTNQSKIKKKNISTPTIITKIFGISRRTCL